MEKSVDLLVSELFLCCDLSVIIFSSKGKRFRLNWCKFHLDSMYGGLNTPCGSNNMKIGKEGSLDV